MRLVTRCFEIDLYFSAIPHRIFNVLVWPNRIVYTTKIKTKMAFTPDIDSDSIKVITENGVVYLMGLITQKDANKVASIAQRTDGTQRIVKAFEYVD